MSLFKQQPKSDLATVYDRYADPLYRFALSQLQNREDAQDVVQDVFLTYLHKSPPFPDEARRKAWLFRVAVNGCRDLFRRRKVRDHLLLDDIADCVAGDAPADAEAALDLMQSLGKIPENYRSILVLHYLEGFPVEDCAAMLGLSLSAAKMRLARGRDALKDQMTKEVHDV